MNVNRSPILITGSALSGSLGIDRETTWQAVLAGRCGFGPMTAMESPLPAGKDGAQAMDLPADYAADLPREARYLRWTISAAVRDAFAGTVPYAPGRCAVLLGTTLHGMRAGGQFLRTADYTCLKNFPAGGTLQSAMAGLPFAGAGLTICSACSSSLGSIAMGVTLLRSGLADCVIAGGYDTISEYVYGGFNSLRLVADGPLRPFSKNRAGMKLAEGYGIVVLERADDFARRVTAEDRSDNASAERSRSTAAGGSRTIAQILGWGESADAHHLTQPHPQGDGAARAMSAALGRANIPATGIDLVAAHATGTPDNDAGEFAALSRVFGSDLSRVPVVGFKSHLGHTLGGAGAVELILSMLALRDQIVPACAGITADDLEFPGLNISIGSAKPATIRATLNTSLGFGGANTCVVLSRAPEFSLSLGAPGEGRGEGLPAERNTTAAKLPPAASPHPNPLPEYREREPSQPLQPAQLADRAHLTSPEDKGTGAFVREVFITGLGVIAPGVFGREGLLARLANPQPQSALTAKIEESTLDGLLNARRIRRMSEYVKLQLAAATMACRDAGFAELGELAGEFSAILGSAHGSANYSYTYYEQIVREGVLGANPMLFAEGVPNAGAAHISLMLGLKGACQSVIGTRTAGLDALALAAARIASGDWERAIVGASEEDSDVVSRAYQHCGLATASESCGAFAGASGFVCAGGAAAFVLESRAAMEARGGRPIGSIDAVAFGRGDKAAMACIAADVLRQIGSPANVLSSASGTWLDDIEAAAMKEAGAVTVSSIYGHVAETFSAASLIGIAAVLAGRSLPAMIGGASQLRGVTAATGGQAITQFGAICTDLTGLVSGVRINIL